MHQKLNAKADENSSGFHLLYSQPWWHGMGHDAVSSIKENGRILLSTGHGSKGLGTSAVESQKGSSNINNERADGDKTNADKSCSFTIIRWTHKRGEVAGCCTSNASNNKRLSCNTFSSAVVACGSYPYSEQYYGQVAHACGTNALPYLHESWHLHAMRRARGCGGRFLNTKKLDHAAKTTLAVAPHASINSSSSRSNTAENSNTSSFMPSGFSLESNLSSSPSEPVNGQSSKTNML